MAWGYVVGTVICTVVSLFGCVFVTVVESMSIGVVSVFSVIVPVVITVESVTSFVVAESCVVVIGYFTVVSVPLGVVEGCPVDDSVI